MSRVKLEMPQSFQHTADIPVRITDINYGHHLGNDALLSILHEARMQCLAAKGFSEIDIGGCGLIMSDIEVAFRAEAFYGDCLRVEVAVTDLSKTSFDIYYRVTKTPSGDEVAMARSGMVCFDYDRKRPARMPEAFRTAYGE